MNVADNDDELLPQAKMVKVLQQWKLLQTGRWNMAQIAKRLDISLSTAYRYNKLLAAIERDVESDFHHHYSISTNFDDPGFKLTLEHLKFIKKHILALPRSIMKESVLEILNEKTAIDKTTPKLTCRDDHSYCIDVLSKAIANRHQVLFKPYHSPSSNVISDRLVEPIYFGDNYQSIIALDTKDLIVKQFKIERIGEAIVKRIKFKHEKLHKHLPCDIFGFTGETIDSITLHLSMLAWLLLKRISSGHSMHEKGKRLPRAQSACIKLQWYCQVLYGVAE